MKRSLLLLFIALGCNERAPVVQATNEQDIPPKPLGDFEINVIAGEQLYSAPNLSSPIVTTVALSGIVRVFSSVRTVANPKNGEPINLIYSSYGKSKGWLNSDALIYRRQRADQLHLFTGKISDFKQGCLTDDSSDSAEVACSNCGTLDFFPWGGFKGTLGCDEHLTGSWYKSGDTIVVKADSEVMCNHAFNHPPTEAECRKFQASTRRSRIITLRRIRDSWQATPEIQLTAEERPYYLFSP